MEIRLDTPEAQMAFGARLAQAMQPPCVLYLEGDLGTGKTTLARGILRELGHQGAVRSPTYTLVEPYALAGTDLYHLDLYRLGDPQELEYLGLRDFLAEDALWIIEWPERGAGMLPPADILIQISYRSQGRGLSITSLTASGEAVLARIGGFPG